MGQDDLDETILRMLQGNGKMTIEEIAEMLDRSPSTIRDRVRRMEEERLILGILHHRRPGKTGDGRGGLVLADIDPEAEGKAISALMSLESVSEVMKVTGEPRLMFRVRAADRQELLRYLDRKHQAIGLPPPGRPSGAGAHGEVPRVRLMAFT